MTLMILGLLIFLGTHSVRMFAPAWRDAQQVRLGVTGWKGVYSVLSVAGLALIIWGYGDARLDPVFVWAPPVWTRHLAALLTLPAFVLLVAAYLPGTRMRERIGHPMVVGVKLWAFAHLLANGTLADILLFGGLLVWAIANFAISRRRDRGTGVVRPKGKLSRDGIAIAIGLIVWFLFATKLHLALIGVRPFG